MSKQDTRTLLIKILDLPDHDRIDLVLTIVQSLNHSLQYQISNHIAIKLNRDFISNLPFELSTKVLDG
jgi:hypothetical protein